MDDAIFFGDGQGDSRSRMKVMIVKEVMKGDVSPVAMFVVYVVLYFSILYCITFYCNVLYFCPGSSWSFQYCRPER